MPPGLYSAQLVTFVNHWLVHLFIQFFPMYFVFFSFRFDNDNKG